MQQSEFEQEIVKIKEHFQKAMLYQESDPPTSLNQSRILAEGICKQVFVLENSDNPAKYDKMMLEEFMRENDKAKLIPNHIAIPLRTIQAFGNFGSHYQKGIDNQYITKEYVKPCIGSLNLVYNWFFTDYLAKLPVYAFDFKYDFFICYAKEDRDWVIKNLKEPLLQTKRKDRKRPILFDESNADLKYGEDNLSNLANALLESRKIILVYSPSFFNDQFAKWMMEKAFQIDISGGKGRILPLVLKMECEKDIPFKYNHIKFLDSSAQNWFSILLNITELSIIKQQKNSKLTFQNKIPDTAVYTILPEFCVELSNRNEDDFEDVIIEIFTKDKEVQGTLQVKSKNGISKFPDISFTQSFEKFQLIAKANGYSSGESNFFKISDHIEIVKPKPPILEPRPTSGSVKPTTEDSLLITNKLPVNEILFFELGKSFMVICESCFFIYSTEGKILGEGPVKSKIKFIKISGLYVVVADWSGNFTIISDNGQFREYKIQGNTNEYVIPAGCATQGNYIFAGFWNGDVYSFSFDTPPVLVLNHPSGIQYIENFNGNLVICDLDDKFYLYNNQTVVFSQQLDKDLKGIFVLESKIIIIGEKTVYQYIYEQRKMLDMSLNLENHQFIISNKNCIAVIDRKGKCILADSELIYLLVFQTIAGSKPIVIDHSNKYFLFSYPDATFIIFEQDHIIHTSKNYKIAFNGQFTKIIEYDLHTLRIIDRQAFLTKNKA